MKNFIFKIFKKTFKKWRCYFCGKIVWFWQEQYLGLTSAHAECDRIDFNNSLSEFYQEGLMTMKEVIKNKKGRESAYWGLFK